LVQIQVSSFPVRRKRAYRDSLKGRLETDRVAIGRNPPQRSAGGRWLRGRLLLLLLLLFLPLLLLLPPWALLLRCCGGRQSRADYAVRLRIAAKPDRIKRDDRVAPG